MGGWNTTSESTVQESKADEDNTLLPRNWCGPSRSDSEIRVFIWNMMADAAAKKEAAELGSPTECMTWEKRKPHIIEEISRWKPDIIGLVELDKINEINEVLEKLGYRGFYTKKIESNFNDGTGIFYKKEKFILEKDPVAKPLHPNESDKEKRPSVFHAVQLKQKQLSSSFVFACVHLTGSKCGTEEILRKFEADMTLKYIKDCFSDCDNVILAGDFNAAKIDMVDKSSPIKYKPLVLPLIEKSGFTSAYEAILGKEPSYTTWKTRGGKMKQYTVDYIMLSKGISPVGVLDVPIEALVPSYGFPNFRYPSDHVALCADLKLPKS